jgi:hypothetical protein
MVISLIFQQWSLPGVEALANPAERRTCSAARGTASSRDPTMARGENMRLSIWGSSAILGLLLAGISPAGAQVIVDMPNIIIPPVKYGSTDNLPHPDVWPRLDQGAVLCRSDADLMTLAAFRRGEAVARPACQIIRQPTPIQIVRRMGPGRTEVSVTGQTGVTGWTDAWLPDRAPASATRAAPRR